MDDMEGTELQEIMHQLMQYRDTHKAPVLVANYNRVISTLQALIGVLQARPDFPKDA